MPVTRPRCRTPIERRSRHSVTSMTSSVRSGPTRVSHSKVVPTPVRWSPVKRMDSASAIHDT